MDANAHEDAILHCAAVRAADEGVPPSAPTGCIEVKFDGYRVRRCAGTAKGDACLRARHWTGLRGFRRSQRTAARSPDCIVDGEICALNGEGASDFGLLQTALSDHKTAALVYYVFDCLLRRRPRFAERAAERAEGGALEKDSSGSGARNASASLRICHVRRFHAQRCLQDGSRGCHLKASDATPYFSAAVTAGRNRNAAAVKRW